jgi:hypothetical protein
VPRRKSRMTWEEFWRGCGVDPPPVHPLSLKKKSKRHREKRFRPEKIVSDREFLTEEHRTEEGLPKHLEVVNPKKRRNEDA